MWPGGNHPCQEFVPDDVKQKLSVTHCSEHCRGLGTAEALAIYSGTWLSNFTQVSVSASLPWPWGNLIFSSEKESLMEK